MKKKKKKTTGNEIMDKRCGRAARSSSSEVEEEEKEARTRNARVVRDASQLRALARRKRTPHVVVAALGVLTGAVHEPRSVLVGPEEDVFRLLVQVGDAFRLDGDVQNGVYVLLECKEVTVVLALLQEDRA